MRHLLLAAPLLALAAACGEPCTTPTLTVAWSFALADGTRGAGCLDAGVAEVSLWIDGQAAGLGMDCAQGAATFSGLSAGSHTFTIQGLSAGGAATHQTWGSLAVDGCGETRVVLQPGAGLLRLDYATSTGDCFGPGRPTDELGYVWFQLVDRSTGAVASTVNASQTPVLLPCRTGTQAQVNVPLPWGLYQLHWMQVVTFPLSTTPTPIYQVCPPLDPAGSASLDVSVLATGVTSLAVPLAPPAAACGQ
jgi:hypothetical protein